MLVEGKFLLLKGRRPPKPALLLDPQTPSRTRACQPTAHHAFPPRTFPATHMPLQPLQRVLELRYPVVGAVGRPLQVHVGHPQHLQPR